MKNQEKSTKLEKALMQEYIKTSGINEAIELLHLKFKNYLELEIIQDKKIEASLGIYDIFNETLNVKYLLKNLVNESKKWEKPNTID